jgi:exopolyphosphatase/guanosine-5'-triphosphate,3'-diphosphate pyrophosphatase
MNKKAPVIAAIDVGTNSFHMVIATVNQKGIMNPITRDKRVVRLGSGYKDMKYIEATAIQRGVDAIKEFVKIAKSENATIRAVATSAVREATNKDDFLKKVLDETGIEIEIVSGHEEARLIYLGTIHALPLYDRKTLVIDIGGGSTETIIGYKGKSVLSHSEKLGAIRLTQMFFDNGISDDLSLKESISFIKGVWFNKLSALKAEAFDLAVGTSGTIQTIAKIALGLNNIQVPDVLNGITVKSKDLKKAIKLIKKTRFPDDRINIQGMDSKRADIIIGGAVILEYALDELGIKELLISPYALREGIVFDTLHKIKSCSEFGHLTDLRRETIYDMMKKYHVNAEHAENVKNMSIKMFDILKHKHMLNSDYRELLESAALLHDVGYSISMDKHHKHSYYIITNATLPGFTNDEAELIGNIARYHRKSLPKSKHDNYTRLSKAKQNAVSILGGILRICEGLDRRHYELISDIKLKDISEKESEIILIYKGNTIPDIELWGALRRVNMLSEALNTKINFKLERKTD